MIDKLFCLFLLAILTAAQVPSYIQVCGRRNPKLDECVRNSVEHIKDKLVEGIPELDVPPINPLTVKFLQLADLPNFKASAANVKIYGFHKYNIEYLHFDFEKKQIDIVVTFEKLNIESEYDLNAKLIIPVIGHGTVEMDIDNVKANLTMYYKIVQRNGKTYPYYNSIRVKVDVADYKANFKPTDEIDNTLRTAINAALLDSKKEILDNTIPNIEKEISKDVLDVSNKIGKHFTYDELFPDRE